MFRVRKDDNKAPENSSKGKTDKTPDISPVIEHVCLCGHSNFHHELIDESSKSPSYIRCIGTIHH